MTKKTPHEAGFLLASVLDVLVGHDFLDLRTLLAHFNFDADFLTFLQSGHAGTFNGGDVHKHILAAIFRRDESKSFAWIKPLHGSFNHLSFLW